MATQGITFNVQDFGLGAVPPGLGNVAVVVGACSTGAANAPVLTSSAATIASTFGFGPAPELASDICSIGQTVMLIRAAQSVAGKVQATPLHVGAGAGTITISGTPNDDYQFQVTVLTGGTIGANSTVVVALSLDAGRSTFQTVQMNSATTIVPPGGPSSYNCGMTLTLSGAFVAGDTYLWYCCAPQCAAGNVASALATIVTNPTIVQYVFVTDLTGGNATGGTPIDLPGSGIGCTVAGLDGNATTLFGQKRFVRIIAAGSDVYLGGASTETELQWNTRMTSDAAANSSLRVGVSAGHYNTISSVTQSQIRRPLLWQVAKKLAGNAIQVDLGRVADGSIPSLTLPSAKDAYVYHDESVNPGLDGARYITAWSVIGRPGLYIKNGNLMAPPGSDFHWIQIGAVVDAACVTWYNYAAPLQGSSVRVNPKTGFILEADARKIEIGGQAAESDSLITPGAVSNTTVTLSRTDNILSTSTINATIAIVPLGYIKAIVTTVQLVNPAISAVGS
jgi:hypothetical protein